jgi:hypothetical protein
MNNEQFQDHPLPLGSPPSASEHCIKGEEIEREEEEEKEKGGPPCLFLISGQNRTTLTLEQLTLWLQVALKREGMDPGMDPGMGTGTSMSMSMSMGVGMGAPARDGSCRQSEPNSWFPITFLIVTPFACSQP